MAKENIQSSTRGCPIKVTCPCLGQPVLELPLRGKQNLNQMPLKPPCWNIAKGNIEKPPVRSLAMDLCETYWALTE